MSESIDGFYTAYFTGRESHGFALLAFHKGRIVGADPVGAKFDGVYQVSENGDIEARVTVLLPPGAVTVQGATAGPDGIAYQVSMALPENFVSQDAIRIETPLGPVNTKFTLMRELL
jgi:hypothetical protein